MRKGGHDFNVRGMWRFRVKEKLYKLEGFPITKNMDHDMTELV